MKHAGQQVRVRDEASKATDWLEFALCHHDGRGFLGEKNEENCGMVHGRAITKHLTTPSSSSSSSSSPSSLISSRESDDLRLRLFNEYFPDMDNEIFEKKKKKITRLWLSLAK